jgi:hypothetical protein
MKTVVVGVFDQLADAGRVIAQLAASPLDMDSVQVVHADTRVQERLAAEAGLPTRRAAGSFLVVGALLGALIGFWLGGGFDGPPAIELADQSAATGGYLGLGPLPGMAAGLLLGAALGLLAGVFGERTEIPPGFREGLLEALGDGATVVAVRTENLPTARAIGDLFRAGGSRILDGAPSSRPAAPPIPGRTDGRVAQGPPTEAMAQPAGAAPEAHQAFVPPWRRAGGDAGSATDPGEPPAKAAADDPAFTLFPEAAAPPPAAAPRSAAREIRHGDVLTGPDNSSRAVVFPDVAPLPSSPGRVAPIADAGPSAATSWSSPSTPPALADLGLPARVVRALEANRIPDTATLIRLVSEDLGALDLIPGVGPIAQRQILTALETAGLRPGG